MAARRQVHFVYYLHVGFVEGMVCLLCNTVLVYVLYATYFMSYEMSRTLSPIAIVRMIKDDNDNSKYYKSKKNDSNK